MSRGKPSARLLCGHSPFTSSSQKQDPFPAPSNTNHQHQDEHPHPAPSVPPSPGAVFTGQSRYSQQTQLLGTPGAPQTHSYISINQQFNLKGRYSLVWDLKGRYSLVWHRSEDSVAQGTGMLPSVVLVSALLLLPGADPADAWSKVKDAGVKPRLSIPGSLSCFPPTAPLLFTHTQWGLCSAWLAHT